MKVAQNDKTVPDTQPVRPTPPLTYRTRNFPPPAPLPENAKHREYFPGCFPPLTGTTSYHVRAHLAPLIVTSRIVVFMFALYSLFLPLLSPVDYETDADATEYDYVTDDPSLSKQPGKPPPLDHQISPILLYTACIRVV